MKKKEIEFSVYGIPIAKGRPRVSFRDGRGRAYTPSRTVKYEELVKFSYIEFRQLNWVSFMDGQPLHLSLDIFMPIPKMASKKKSAMMISGEIRPTKKPDIDNLIKGISDALNGLAYNDDSQIVSITANKYYSSEPRVHVRILEIENILKQEIWKGN